eukprot:scaffold2552_cov380-Prasinococcus_capsulatus_cf.AAC.38
MEPQGNHEAIHVPSMNILLCAWRGRAGDSKDQRRCCDYPKSNQKSRDACALRILREGLRARSYVA